MIGAGAWPLQKLGLCLRARKCSAVAAARVPSIRRRPSHRLELRPARAPAPAAAAGPAQPGDSSVGTGAAPGPLGGNLGGAETNGAPSGAVAVAAGSGHDAGGAGDVSANGGHSSFPVAQSARSSFRTVLKRTYLGEMLFVVIGSAICGGLAYWTIGTSLRRFNPYSFHVTLPEATGVQMGTPVRMKGVPIGSVLTATPLLDRVRVEVEVNEAKTIIPRSAKFELTQSGLIPAASIDITTPEGVSAEALAATVAAAAAPGRAGSPSSSRGSSAGEAAQGDAAATETAAAAEGAAGRTSSSKRAAKVRLAGPKEVAACRLQGVLVCQGDEVVGLVGGSMDELTARMLKSLRQGEAEAEADGAAIVPGRGPLQG